MSFQYDLEHATEGLLAGVHDTGDAEKDWVDPATASESLHELR